MGQLELLLTFLIYITIFAMIGYSRGIRRELWVLAVSAISWLLLQERGDIFVRIANIGSKFVAFLKAGGLSENPEEAFAALGEAPAWVTDDTRAGFLFLLWIIILVFTYMTTNRLIKKNNPSNGWAALVGIANGLFYATVFVPRLLVLLLPPDTTTVAAAAERSRASALDFVRNGLQAMGAVIGAFWDLIEPIRPYVLLLLLTLFLVFTYSTIRTAKAKS